MSYNYSRSPQPGRPPAQPDPYLAPYMPSVNPMTVEDYERQLKALQTFGMGQDSPIPSMVKWRKDNLESNMAAREGMRDAALSFAAKAAGAM